jgi:hypothetical protein
MALIKRFSALATNFTASDSNFVVLIFIPLAFRYAWVARIASWESIYKIPFGTSIEASFKSVNWFFRVKFYP